MVAIRKSLLEQGVYAYTHWHTILVIPPLIINEAQLQEGFTAINNALSVADKIVKTE
jgi:taurine--2-oxoglutarate transaminase